MSRPCFLVFTVAACSHSPSLADYFPELPPPTGGAPSVFAGQITDASQLVTGPAQSGLVGDFFLRNDRVAFVVQAPSRVIGVIPQGGNVVDAVLLDASGKQSVEDHFGELAMVYGLGRTCEPTRLEVIRDGSGGGVAALRAIGKTGNDDFINLKGMGVLPVANDEDPSIDDSLDCATTYVLAPHTTSLQVTHSLYADTRTRASIDTSLGTIADTGGNTEAWTNTFGFERADLNALQTLEQPRPSDYVVFQGPGVAYGIIPRHDHPTAHTHAVISGVSVMLDGVDQFFDLFDRSKAFLHLAPGRGAMQRYELVVARDASEIDAAWRAGNGETAQPIAGRVAYPDGTPAVGARVGVFADGNGNGAVDDESVVDASGQLVDRAVTYFDVATDGTYSGTVPTTAGNLLVRAEVKNVGRSHVAPPSSSVDLVIPTPIRLDFNVVDADTGAPIPAHLVVLGDHLAFPDGRMFETYDRLPAAVTALHAIRGTSGDDTASDPPIYLPGGGTYRVYASRGTEWSIDSAAVTQSTTVTLTLKHVVPTPGYLATDWHVHQVGSPDSVILSDERIKSAVSSGVEVFAVTDHDYVSDLQPLVVSMGLQRVVRALPGIEVTPFAYGHFNAWPLVPDDTSANKGAIDWGRGTAGFAMTPSEIFGAMRGRGAQMVQVNHPRNSGIGEFQAAFSRANVVYDYDARTIYGDYQHADVPNDWLHLPGESLWSDGFSGLEIWNGMAIDDSGGERVIKSLDLVMHDWLAMLSLGFYVTPAGDSDTHTTNSDPLGMPRTYVRVADDSPDAIESGACVTSVLATQTGAGGVARDVVITDGPMIAVTWNGQPALGRVVPSVGVPVTLDVSIVAADWAEFDTLEVFANTTPSPIVGVNDDSILVPLACWTSRDGASLAPNDSCMRAPLAPRPMTVTLARVPGAGTYYRYEATVSITLDPTDIATRSGASGKDAWLVFRARGGRGIFPLSSRADTVTADTLPALMSGDPAQLAAALHGRGVPAEAVTAPVFVDFDGNGYRAPFAP